MKRSQQVSGWLDNYNESKVTIPQGFVGQGETIPNWKSPAWGGQFQEGGIIPPGYREMSGVISMRNQDKNFVQRGLHPENYPVIHNEDGSVSTHRMSYATGDNGEAYVYPNIHQNPTGELQQLEGREAWNYAKQNNENIKIPNIDLAKFYTENGLIKHYRNGGEIMNVASLQNPIAQRGMILPGSQKATKEVRKRIYNTVQPGLYPDNIQDRNTIISDIINNRNRFDLTKIQKEYGDLSKELEKVDNEGDVNKVNILLDKLTNYNNVGQIDDPYSEAAWRKYLEVDTPQQDTVFTKSKYQPSTSSDKNREYYSLPKEFENELVDIYNKQGIPTDGAMSEYVFPNSFGENKSKARVLGNFKVDIGGTGKDKYLSYYDKYDLHPDLPILGKTNIDVIGTPFEIYNRIPIPNNNVKEGKAYTNPIGPEPLYASGGNIKQDDNGYWDESNYYQPILINSNKITMKGTKDVPHNVRGISLSTGETIDMKKGKEYTFKEGPILEVPTALNGISQQNDVNGKQLEQLLNFTNQNKPSKGWLSKFD